MPGLWEQKLEDLKASLTRCHFFSDPHVLKRDNPVCTCKNLRYALQA